VVRDKENATPEKRRPEVAATPEPRGNFRSWQQGAEDCEVARRRTLASGPFSLNFHVVVQPRVIICTAVLEKWCLTGEHCDQTFCEKSAQFCQKIAQNKNFFSKKIVKLGNFKTKCSPKSLFR
jgi:hypothetical protein